MGAFIDLTGQQFGVFKVLEKDIETSKAKKKIYWTCECQKCKSIWPVRADNLKRKPESCLNCKHDLTKQRFGRLVVLYKTRVDKNGHSYWMCQCDCGKQKEISSSNLKDGKTLSCGCLHSETASKMGLKNIIGQKFNYLTVLERATPVGITPVQWWCQCECGTIVSVRGTNLKNNHTISCGCITSKGEAKIRNILNELNIKYCVEYTFKDLPNRRFDFAIFDKANKLKCLIEFDGKQHFSFVETWHLNGEEFIKAKQRDIEKNNYCKKHKIPLIRISYKEYNNLNTLYLLQRIEEEV